MYVCIIYLGGKCPTQNGRGIVWGRVIVRGVNCRGGVVLHSVSIAPLLLRGAPDTAQILCQSFMLKRHRQLQVMDLPKGQGPCVAASVGFEPTTLRTKCAESTNEPPRPIIWDLVYGNM